MVSSRVPTPNPQRDAGSRRFATRPHRWPLAILCGGVLALGLTALAQEGSPGNALRGSVGTKAGVVSGVSGRNAGITAFKGIPFAAPPVGDGRWRAPEPPAAWEGVRAAEAFSPGCIQAIVKERKPWTYEFMTHGDVSEDCLYLNVWTPARSAEERRPVFVYIYGGGNNEGSAAVPVYDGEGLASKGLVVVTFNYRVGTFGFFAHPELSKEAPYGASGNYGLLDQIAAVRWVQENISAFGGDPGNVTVAGQSAGANAVHNLTASPLARGLFHRAIAQSGSSINASGGRTLQEQEAEGVRFAQAKGADSVAALRALTAEQIVAPVQETPVFRFNTVVVDGHALPAPVRQIFLEGRQNDVPTLLGGNADEGGASPRPAGTVETFHARARERFGDGAGTFLRLYPVLNDLEARRAANESARDQARVSMYVWALQRASTAKTAAYTYFFTHPLPGPDQEQYGAFHTSEVPYVLNTLDRSDRPFVDGDRRIADLMSSYWVNFAASGDPNAEGLPAWPAVDPKTPATMELGRQFRSIPLAATRARVEFLLKTLTPAAPGGPRQP